MREDYPDHLGVPFDWRSVPHDELHRMVHDGLNPEAGAAVADRWAGLGSELSAVGAELADLRRITSAAWEGGTAALVVDSIAGLSQWAQDAGDTATEVGDQVMREVLHAARARDAMPPPVGDPDEGTRTFAGGFWSAPDLLLDQGAELARRHERHAEAARVMDQFQVASREVYRDVPRFAPPDPARHPSGDALEPPVQEPVPPLSATAPAASLGAGGSLAGGAPLDGSGGGGVSGRTSWPGPGDPRPGPLAGARPDDSASPARWAPRTMTPAQTTASGFGAMPLSGMAGGREPDREHRGLEFLTPPEFWECDQVVSAAVIGAPVHDA